jgi:hypothetical protein
MALTADQTAVLELLLAGQGFADLAELLDLDEDEVRMRAREALGALGGADPDRNVALSAYLLGQADPIGRADAVRHLRQDADDHALASALAERLREIAPGADLPDLPPAPGGRRSPRAAAPSATKAGPSRPGLPAAARLTMPTGKPLYALLGGGAIVLVLVILAAAGAFSGDDPSTTTDSTANSSATPGEVAGDEVERVALTSPGNGDASGEAVVGATTADQPYLDLTLQNLEAAPRDKVYVVWFLFNDRLGYPLSPIAPDAQGSFEDRFAIPTPAIQVLLRTRYINVSLAPVDEVRRVIQKAVDDQQIVVQRPGETVLQNAQPISSAGDQAAPGG